MGSSSRSYFVPSVLFALLLILLSSFVLHGVDAAPIRAPDVLDVRNAEPVRTADILGEPVRTARDIEMREPEAEPNKCVEYINSKGQTVKGC